MRKVISAMEARRKFGSMLNEVALKDDRFIIERAGKPIAAIVSIDKLMRLEQAEENARQEFFEWVKEVRKRAKKYSEAEITKRVDEAVRSVRSSKFKSTT